jgi:4-amino-4-deoxy-L-arabinose transferase-like glycosyltransferase
LLRKNPATVNNKEFRNLIIIFLIALSLRMILFITAGSWQDQVLKENIFTPDAHEYHQAALNYNQYNIFSTSEKPPYVPEIRRTPLYPLFLSLIYAAFGARPHIALMIQIIIGSLTCIIVYKLGKIIFNENVALIAGLLCAFEYSTILYNNIPITETLFTFLFLIHIFFFVKYMMDNFDRELIYSAVFLGLATLCRPISIYFFIFLSLSFFMHFRNKLKTGVLNYAFFILVFFLTIAPWMVRNYAVSGTFLISTFQKEVVHWNIPQIKSLGQKTNRRPSIKEDHHQQGNKFQNQSQNSYKTKDETQKISTIRNIINVIVLDTQRYVIGIAHFFSALGSSSYSKLLGYPYTSMNAQVWTQGTWEDVLAKIQEKSRLEWLFLCFAPVFLLFLYSTMCFGIYSCMRENKLMVMTLFLSIIIYFTIATGPVASYSERYRVPIMPYIILLSCYGVTRLFTKMKKWNISGKKITKI